MNCQQGELAIIVGSRQHPENNGKIVDVVRRVVPGEVIAIGGRNLRLRYNRTADWIVETRGSDLLFAMRAGEANVVVRTRIRPIGDRFLRPLRDQEGEDEILRKVGLPQGVTA